MIGPAVDIGAYEFILKPPRVLKINDLTKAEGKMAIPPLPSP